MASTSRKIVQVPDADWIDPTENPEKANAEIEALISGAKKPEDLLIDLPAGDVTDLPGGLIKSGKVIRTVRVKELTGEDEEAIAKASLSGKIHPFIDRLIRCGVVQIGDFPESKKDDLLKEMLVGDREHLMLEIRRATYGEKLEINDWQCFNCRAKADLVMELDDIPATKMENPLEEISFTVPLRKGGEAHVKLATGDDQKALYEKEDLTVAQQETILLSRCVHKIVDPSGMEHNVAAFPTEVLRMSVVDRHNILRELKDRQPGPRFNEVEYTCEVCEEKGMVAVGVGHLFLDFGWF